jgi:hypothetical protein
MLVHNEELNDLHSTPNIVRMIKSRRIRWTGHVVRSASTIKGFSGKCEEKIPLGRPWRRWEYNIKTDLQKVGCGDMDWIELAQATDRWRALVNAVMNLWGSIKCGEFLD